MYCSSRLAHSTKVAGILVSVFSVLAVSTALTLAQPAQISLQGVLNDSGGSPIAGPVNMTFRLYADSVGGAPFFAETHNAVSLSNGLYNLNLGSINALDGEEFAQNVWMGVQINTESEMTPRALLTAAPTAMTLTLPTELIGSASSYGATTLLVQNLATGGQNYTLTALSGSTNGRALYGYSTHLTGLNYGVYGLSRSSAGVGVRGRASSASGATIGVEGLSDSESGQSYGILGVATESPSGIGVKGQGGSYGGSFEGPGGLKATAASSDGNDLVLGGTDLTTSVGRISSDPDYSNSSIVIESNTDLEARIGAGTQNWFRIKNSVNQLIGQINSVDYELVLDVNNTAATGSFELFGPSGPSVFTVTENGDVTVSGNHQVSGSKNAVVETSSHGSRLVYSMESPEVWFEDFGTATLEGGSVRIELDPVFLETVTIDQTHPMKVFLQPANDTPGLYVKKDVTGFSVFERQGGSGSVTFDYRVVAKRRAYESMRLEPAGVLQNRSAD